MLINNLINHPTKKRVRIVVISDTHITHGGRFDYKVFTKGIKKIQKIKHVNFIIHLGDITDSGTLAEYNYALDLFKPLKKIFYIPGNHDSRNVGYLLFEELIGARNFEIEENNFYIIGVDSSIPDSDSGVVGRRTISATRKKFLEHEDKLKLFCIHHQILPVPYTGRERSVVEDAGNILQMALDVGVSIILNGHRHIENVYTVSGGLENKLIINAGTFSCTKTRYKAMHNFHVLDIEKKQVKLHTIRLDGMKDVVLDYTIGGRALVMPPQSKPLCRIVQISDTHFTDSREFRDEMYDRAVFLINKLNPDVVVHCGDVTDNGYIDEFRIAKRKLAQIMSKKLILPGPRDLFAVGWDVFPRYIGPLDPIFETSRMKIIGVNTCVMGESMGKMGRRKLNEVLMEIKKLSKRKLVGVAFHHHLVPCPRTRNVVESDLSDSGDTLKMLAESEVDFILNGHEHISFNIKVENVVVSNVGSLSSRKILTLKENVFNILEIYRNGYVRITEVEVRTGKKTVTGEYRINILK